MAAIKNCKFHLLAQLGVELFGVLTLVWALMGYFSLFDFGLGRALTQRVSQRRSSQEHLAERPALIKCGVLLSTALGGAGGVVLTFGAVPFATEVLKVSPALRQDVFHALLMTAVGIPVTTATVGLRGVLEAYEDCRVGVDLMLLLICTRRLVFPQMASATPSASDANLLRAGSSVGSA